MIEADDPFRLVLPLPCGPWNALTQFNTGRFESSRKRVDATREEHKVMLRWVARKARERVLLGCIALLENPHTSRAYKLEFFESLEGIEDGLLANAFFEFIVGDQ